MTVTNHENTRPFVPPNSQSFYHISITFNFWIPKIKRRNNVRGVDDENGSKSKKKHVPKSRESFRKRVGVMFSNVFGNKKLSPETGSGSSNGNGKVHWDGDWDQMENWKKFVERSVGMESAKTREKGSENHLYGGVRPTVVATGLGISKSRMFKELLEDEDKAERRGKQQDRVSKFFSKLINDLEMKKGETTKADDGVGDRGAKTVARKKGKVMGKQEKKSRPKLKIAWSMKKMMGGKSEKQELCKKRILMGGRCRPLGTIQYDENGFLLLENIP
ncbi:hypothetical protein QQP08_016873 [Theobroma cacao]|nr:hypothetical protein QQP08_016873 [Theobroma cacao]